MRQYMTSLITSVLSVYGHVYIIASLLEPDETLDVTLRFTRQLQDELTLYKSKIAAATREADNEYRRGNTMMGSFRFIKNDARAKIQTAINAGTLSARAFILLFIISITALVDGFKFHRHIVHSNVRSLTTKKQKILKYLSKQPINAANHQHQPVVTFAEPTAAYFSDTDGEGEDDDRSRPESDHLPWFKTLFPSVTSSNNNHHPSLISIDVTPVTLSPKMEKQNEWNGIDEGSSSMPAHVPNIHTTTLFIGQNNDDANSCHTKNASPPPSLSPPSPSSSLSKSSLSTTATNKSLFFIKKRQSSIGKKASPPSSSSPLPPRPLASYSERPFTTSNALITTTSNHMSYPLGSSLSLKLKHPGRRLSRLFRNKTKTKKNVMQK